MTSDTGIKVELERTVSAKPERVYETLTKAEKVGLWLGPSDDYKVAVHDWDCKVGGKYRVEFNTPEGETHIVVGEFKELAPGKTVAFTWTWEGQPVMNTLVTFKLEPEGDGTKVHLSHVDFPNEEAKGHHEQGWIGTLDRLNRAV